MIDRQQRNFWMAVLVLAAMAGCAKKPMIKTESAVTPPIQVSKDVPPKQEESDDAELSLKGKEFVSVKELGVVYFDFDQSELRADTRQVAMKNAEYLKLHPSLEVRIDGHCDERGTTEYNLALGQRRATALRAYYKSLGVAGERIATQSWGEEKPACSELTEACYGKNRRGETMVRSTAPTKGSSASTGNASHQPSNKPQ